MFFGRYGVRVISSMKGRDWCSVRVQRGIRHVHHAEIYHIHPPGNFFTQMHLFVISARNGEDIVSTRMNENEFR